MLGNQHKLTGGLTLSSVQSYQKNVMQRRICFSCLWSSFDAFTNFVSEKVSFLEPLQSRVLDIDIRCV